MTSVLITGGAGFIGHHVVQHLLNDFECRITIIDRLDESGNLNRLADIGAAKNRRVRFVYHDLRAPMSTQVINQIGVHDYILHLAAATHVDRSIADPMAFVMDNVVGTCTMLEFARKSGCKAFVYFSTDEVFGPAAEGQAFKEWDRYKSGNPYAATKAGGEELALAYHNTYGVPVIITHTMNVVGRRQHWEKFVPSTIGKVLKGEIVTIHASPDMKTPGSRFYISADSVAEALVRISETGEEAGQKFNIVGAEEINNLDMARRIAAAMRKELRYELVDFHSSRPGHDLRYALDGQLLRDKLGFAPKLDIKPVVDWYLHNPSWLAPGCKEMLT